MTRSNCALVVRIGSAARKAQFGVPVPAWYLIFLNGYFYSSKSFKNRLLVIFQCKKVAFEWNYFSGLNTFLLVPFSSEDRTCSRSPPACCLTDYFFPLAWSHNIPEATGTPAHAITNLGLLQWASKSCARPRLKWAKCQVINTVCNLTGDPNSFLVPGFQSTTLHHWFKHVRISLRHSAAVVNTGSQQCETTALCRPLPMHGP